MDVDALVERYGTPLFIYRLDRVAYAHDELIATLPHPSTLFYSLKANPHPDLVRKLVSRGCHVEVSSIGELQVALSAGVALGCCLYTGPGKAVEELDAAIRLGVRLFSVESSAEIGRLDSAARSSSTIVECVLRVNGEQSVGTSSLRMAGMSSQFGTDASQILKNPEAFRGTSHVAIAGLHFFSASNVQEEESLIDSFKNNLELAVRIRRTCDIPLRWLDLGGGFAAPYGRPGELLRYPDLRQQLEAALDTQLVGWREQEPRIAFESGRYLVATCGTLVATIIETKRSGNRTFAILDTGIHHLGGLSGLGRLLPLASQPLCPTSEEMIQVDLAGPLCTPADILGRNVRLSRSRPGDVVTIPNVGAYGPTASLLGFLSRPAPVEAVVDGDQLCSVTRVDLRRLTIQGGAA